MQEFIKKVERECRNHGIAIRKQEDELSSLDGHIKLAGKALTITCYSFLNDNNGKPEDEVADLIKLFTKDDFETIGLEFDETNTEKNKDDLLVLVTYKKTVVDISDAVNSFIFLIEYDNNFAFED